MRPPTIYWNDATAAYEIFNIKHIFQQSKFWPPTFKESFLRGRQIWVPLKRIIILLLQRVAASMQSRYASTAQITCLLNQIDCSYAAL